MVDSVKGAAKKVAKVEDKPKAPRGGLAQQVTPDAALAAVVGKDPATRADITKRIWDYVRDHKLQDAKDRRMIVADDKLKPVFGGKDKVSMFEMTRLVSQHVS